MNKNERKLLNLFLNNKILTGVDRSLHRLMRLLKAKNDKLEKEVQKLKKDLEISEEIIDSLSKDLENNKIGNGGISNEV
jgi:uncharacterized protein (DUF342 family)